MVFCIFFNDETLTLCGYKSDIAEHQTFHLWHIWSKEKLSSLEISILGMMENLKNKMWFWNNCCFCSVANSCPALSIPRTTAHQASLSFTISYSLLKLMSIKSVMPFNYLVLCCHLFFLLSIFPSIGVSSIVLALCIRWPKYWSFSFSIRPSNEYSELISLKIIWFYLLAGTLKSLPQLLLLLSHFSSVWPCATP